MFLHVIFQANFIDKTELSLQPIDVLFFGFEDILEQVTADVILDGFAVRKWTWEIAVVISE